MPIQVLTKQLKTQLGRRVLVSGPPNSRKTTSLMTWPHSEQEGFLHIVNYPGEKGYDTLDLDDPWLKPYIWQVDDPTKTPPHTVVKEVEESTWQILAGKHGKVATFAGEGLHKLYGWYYHRALVNLTQGGADEEKVGGRAFGQAHEDFLGYLTKVCASNAPYIVFTVWVGREKDDPTNLDRKAPSHIWPDLPGQLAQRILGEFSVTLYAQVGQKPAPDKPAPAWWQIRPGGQVWGAAVKAPPRVAVKLPERVAQSFTALRKVLEEAPMQAQPTPPDPVNDFVIGLEGEKKDG